MSNTTTNFHPFAYNFDEGQTFTSFMTQRDAKFKKTAEEVYNNKKLSDEELMWESFRDNIEPPTPQIMEIDGYDAEEDNSNEGGCGDGGNEGNEGNEGGTDTEGGNTGN